MNAKNEAPAWPVADVDDAIKSIEEARHVLGACRAELAPFTSASHAACRAAWWLMLAHQELRPHKGEGGTRSAAIEEPVQRSQAPRRNGCIINVEPKTGRWEMLCSVGEPGRQRFFGTDVHHPVLCACGGLPEVVPVTFVE